MIMVMHDKNSEHYIDRKSPFEESMKMKSTVTEWQKKTSWNKQILCDAHEIETEAQPMHAVEVPCAW